MLLALPVLPRAYAAGAALEIEFASIEAARVVLAARDGFVAELSPFDRAARLRADHDVSEAEYLEFVSAAPEAWTDAERRRVQETFDAIAPALMELLAPRATPILMIKTAGAEEGGAGAYTRGDAVILPAASVRDRSLERNLAHEIFHVISRRDPDLRHALYALIGFEYCGAVEHPAELAARRMTNPDAPVNEHCIRLQLDGRAVWAVPILFAREPRYDPAGGRSFFDYLSFRFLVVDRSAGPERARPARDADGRAVLAPIERVTGFFEQVGRNTDYVIHPEEIMASNFAMLVRGDPNAPSPELLAQMREVLVSARRLRAAQ